MTRSAVLVTLLIAAVASAAGVGLGIVRKQLSDGRAVVPTEAQLAFLSPLLAKGAVRGETFIGDFSPAAWQALGPAEKAQAAQDLSVRLLDTHHAPSAVIFSGDRPAVIISMATPRLIDE